MQSTRILQVAIIVLVGGLVAFLFFNGKSNPAVLIKDRPEDEEIISKFPKKGFNFALLEDDIKKELGEADRADIEGLDAKLGNKENEQGALLKLAVKFDSLNQPAMSGYYYKQLAEANPGSEDYWYKTGKKFFEAQQTVSDSTSFAYFVGLSMDAYAKVLELNPKNFEAKAEQAVNYIEGSSQPMQGVGLLREIIQVEPEHRKALFYLGVLSIQSGQMEKAAERFEKLISLGPSEDDPGYPFYFRYLGQVYTALGQKQKALEAYKKYKLYTGSMSDPKPAQEAEQLIKSLEAGS